MMGMTGDSTRRPFTETDPLLMRSERNIQRYSGPGDAVECGDENRNNNRSDLLETRHDRRKHFWNHRRRSCLLTVMLCVACALLQTLASSRSWHQIVNDANKLSQPHTDTKTTLLIKRSTSFLLPYNIAKTDGIFHGGDSNTTTPTTPSHPGETIPLTPAYPTAPTFNNNNLSTTTTPYYTKIGVVKTKPGQGPFFYYWFGHDVFDAIRKERVARKNNQQEKGILSFALHPQQGQPDTFWLYQSFSSEAYYLKEFTPNIYTNNNTSGRIQKMIKFLSDDAPLLDLELKSPPICSKGINFGKEKDESSYHGHSKHRKSKKQHHHRALTQHGAGFLLPPGTIYPPNLEPTPDNDSHGNNDTAMPFENITSDAKSFVTDSGKNHDHRTKHNRPPSYTVMMHLTTQPGNGMEFGEWFCASVFESLLRDDTTLTNFAMHQSSPNPDEFWIYQTFDSQRAFLQHVQTVFTTTVPSWWRWEPSEQAKTENHGGTSNIAKNKILPEIVKQELQRYLQKPVRYIALEPTLLEFGIRMHPESCKKGHGKHIHSKDKTERKRQHKKKLRKKFSPLHILHHPP